MNSPLTNDARKKMMPQLDLAEDELNKILVSLNPPDDEMLKELHEKISLIKRDIIVKLDEYY